MRLLHLSIAALVTALPVFGAHAATLTCQDRWVRGLAEWAMVDGDSARAGDFGLFDGQASGLVTESFPHYTAAQGSASQRSEIAGNAIQARCRADAQFVSFSDQSGAASGTSELDVCFRLHAAATMTILAQATAFTWSGAPAAASFVLAGPGGMRLELQRDCGEAGCDTDSLLAVTVPALAGDYTVHASANAEAAGTQSGNWLSGITLEFSLSLGEPFVSVAHVNWAEAKRLYRRRRRHAHVPRRRRASGGPHETRS